MKTKYLLLIFIIFIKNELAAQINMGQDTSPAILTRDSSKDFPWVRCGKVFSQRINIKSGSLNIYIYQSPSGELTLLSGRIDGLNVILKTEVAQGDAQRFIENILSGLLVDTMATGPDVIIKSRKIDIVSSEEKLRESYVLDTPPRIIGNEWSLHFNIATRSGGVEGWRISGRVSPLCILSFTRQILASSGTLRPILLTK